MYKILDVFILLDEQKDISSNIKSLLEQIQQELTCPLCYRSVIWMFLYITSKNLLSLFDFYSVFFLQDIVSTNDYLLWTFFLHWVFGTISGPQQRVLYMQVFSK